MELLAQGYLSEQKLEKLITVGLSIGRLISWKKIISHTVK
jgi:hypothetical protein